MWILYIVLAVVMSTGAGLFMSQNAAIETRDIARMQAPEVHGEDANRIARYLRRMYQDNPALFPTRPAAGRAPVPIPTTLVRRALTQGSIAPANVSFMLTSDGNIIAVFSPSFSIAGAKVDDTVNRVIEREGGNTHIYGRLDVPVRRTYANVQPLSRMAAVNQGNSTTSGGIVLSGGGANGNIQAGNENGVGGNVGIPPATGPTPPYTPPGTIGGGGNTGGGNTGGGNTGGGNSGGGNSSPGIGTGSAPDGSDTFADVGTLTGMDDLESGGGRGGSRIIDNNSYTVIFGFPVVNAGFEQVAGPRANFYSLTQLANALQSNGLKTQTLGFVSSGEPRVAHEKKFNEACQQVFDKISNSFQSNMLTYRTLVGDYNLTLPASSRKTRAEMDEGLEQIEGAVLAATIYCMSVFTDRMGNDPLPIRANMGHVRNIQGLRMGANAIDTWKANNNSFMQATNFTTNVPNATSKIKQFKSLMADVTEIQNLVQTYPR